MHRLSDLKRKLLVSETVVECPVKKCDQKVARQRKRFRRDKIFQCPTHEIYISPSTFEYSDELDNLLWRSSDDVQLFERVKRVKRESRIARDNSEDAVTWNVFRYLEKTRQLSRFLSVVAGCVVGDVEMIYWSYSQITRGTWAELSRAREEFGEDPRRSSEPDLIAVSERAMFWIEAKLTAGNNCTPSNALKTKNYLTGGDGWHRRTFTTDFETIAINSRLYELYRFWLLGTWAASKAGRDFFLINLVRAGRDADIEQRFGQYIDQTPQKRFKRLTWEDIYRHISFSGDPGPGRDKILEYLFLWKNHRLQLAA